MQTTDPSISTTSALSKKLKKIITQLRKAALANASAARIIDGLSTNSNISNQTI